MIDNSDRLLMSDDIKGMIPELESETLNVYNDSFVVATLDLSVDESTDIIVGSVAGISFESSAEIKLDVRVNIDEAFRVIKKYKTAGLSCRMLYMYLGDDELSFEGPYGISCPKMMDFDHQNKMCTLGVDLIKI